MGAVNSKTDFCSAVIELTSKKLKVDEDVLWEELCARKISKASDFFAHMPAAQVRNLRDKHPSNLASFCYKTVAQLSSARDSPSTMSPIKVMYCVRLLTRLIPYLFEDADWRNFFWNNPLSDQGSSYINQPLACTLVSTLTDLLFCPGFTVASIFSRSEQPDDLATLDTCEYIWEAGVGYTSKTSQNADYDNRRMEILKLLLTCFSEIVYSPSAVGTRLQWISRFTSAENRHVLPLFTSLLNVICAYDPVGFGIPYNYLLFADTRELLVQTSLQVLTVCLDIESQVANGSSNGYMDNFFINYLSRIHREEDFEFILKGITRLLSNPIQTTYLPNSMKRISFYQELLVLLWKCCEYNQKFLFSLLKTADVLEILVPILFHVCNARLDPARVGLIHMGVFMILLLSGERNFGVRLNKPYVPRAVMDIQSFTGTHADLLIIVFHKLITTGNFRLQSLFDCFLTVIVNVSPYLKTISMAAANKLVHLVEAFSTPWFLYSDPNNYLLVFFLLEAFNNIIQYQFDGNSNLVYTIIRKRQVFYQLSNLASDTESISKAFSSRKCRSKNDVTYSANSQSIEKECVAPEKGTMMNATLAATPSMTQKSTETYTAAAETEEYGDKWIPTSEWIESWKSKLPLQTIMRLLQVLVPQVEQICIDKGLTDESEILKFLQHGTLVGLLPVPHPILIRKYQANEATEHWFRTFLWGVIYLRNMDPPIWIDTNVKLFEIQKT